MKIATLAVAAAVLVIAGCGSITKAPAPASTALAALASPKAAAPPSSGLSGPVGTVYTVSDQSGNKMTVILIKMIDPALGADQFTTPGNGNRFVGAVFTITGISGTFSDDANNDATLIGSNGQTYTADFDGIAGYTNFNDGEYAVSAGESSVGAVTFQVPLAVTVSKIEWSANGGFGGAPAEWLVPAASQGTATTWRHRPLGSRQGLLPGHHAARSRGGSGDCSATIPKTGMPASWRATPTQDQAVEDQPVRRPGELHTQV